MHIMKENKTWNPFVVRIERTNFRAEASVEQHVLNNWISKCWNCKWCLLRKTTRMNWKATWKDPITRKSARQHYALRWSRGLFDLSTRLRTVWCLTEVHATSPIWTSSLILIAIDTLSRSTSYWNDLPTSGPIGPTLVSPVTHLQSHTVLSTESSGIADRFAIADVKSSYR